MSKHADILGTPLELDVDDDDIVLDAVLLMRVTKFDSERGTSQLVFAASDNTDFITQIGMFQTALLELGRAVD